MKERLGAKDYRFLAVCLLLLGGTVWYSIGNFYRAFPEASIDFKVSREDAQAVAARFLGGQGYRIEGYRQAAQFAYDDEAKTFLEREAGLEQANRIMGARVRLWLWSYRWFRPLEKEEYSVGVTPRGQVAAFEHELPENAARPDATEEQARALAENFLRTRMGRDPGSLDFVEVSDTVRPHRTDRTFTWKERDFSLPLARPGIAGDSSYRISVGMLGTEVGSYREYLKIPEQWTRDYQRLRARNETAQMVDTVVTVLLVVGMVIVIVMRVRRHDVPWRRAAIVGLIGMGLGFLSQLNEFPLHEFSYPTTDSYGSFVSRQMLNAILVALGMGGLVFVLTAAAEPLYREAMPGQVSLGHLFSLRGLRTKRFFLGAVLGITLTGIFIAYQTAFYILAYRYGAWSPADVPYTDLLNTKFPWAYVLFGGFLPAVSEEFLFRMFAIPFLRKVTRSLVAGLVLAGFIWGFGHSGYPQQPFYIRGVEVGIGGMALGMVMLRWGILPTLVWHYSVDAMYSAMLMVRSEHLYYKLSGAAAAGIVVLPVVAALAAYWRGGGFAPVEGLLNRDEPPPAAEPPAEPAAIPLGAGAEYITMGTRKRWAAAAVAVAGLLTLGIPVHRFGRSPVYKVSAESARQSSNEFLKTQSVEPGAFESVTYPDAHWGRGDQLAAKYFWERLPLERASAMFERNRPLQHWATRYFRALDREELTVSVHSETARVRAVSHTIPEDRPGADLPPEQAQQIAAQFAASMGSDVSGMDLKESSSDKKKARRDYALEWEARAGDPRNVDEAHWRVHVGVAGDRAVDLRSYWKTPETFDRERDRQSALSIAMTVARLVTIAGLAVYGLWLLIHATRKGEVPWRRAIRMALPATLLFPVAGALSLSLMMKDYDTAIPLQTFKAVTYMVLVMSVLLGFLMLTAAAAILATNYPDAAASFSRAGRRAMGLDAAVALLAALGLGIAANQTGALLIDRFHAQAVLSLGPPALVGITAPAVAAVAGAVRGVLMDAAALGLIALLVRRARKRWMVITGGLVGVCAMASTGIHTPGEFALGYASALVTAACAVAFCLWFGRRNWLAYTLVLWVMALRGPMMELLGNGNPSLDVQGWIIAAVIVVSVGWVVMPALRSRTS